jgi:hypothetical protein
VKPRRARIARIWRRRARVWGAVVLWPGSVGKGMADWRAGSGTGTGTGTGSLALLEPFWSFCALVRVQYEVVLGCAVWTETFFSPLDKEIDANIANGRRWSRAYGDPCKHAECRQGP